jgi:hypothetical protein
MYRTTYYDSSRWLGSRSLLSRINLLMIIIKIIGKTAEQLLQVTTKESAPVRLELTTFRLRLTVGRCNQLSHGAVISHFPLDNIKPNCNGPCF